jgi:NADPH2:quinone reductase
MLPLFASGRIRPVIDQVFRLDDMPKAQARMESNAQVGKIVLRM